MRFIDEVQIVVISGSGGNGCLGFRREKFIPFGGPDGGNGGDGGSVFFEADEGKNTLLNFRGRKTYKAPAGDNGQKREMCGVSGEDLLIKVPVGTIIKDVETGATIADLSQNKMKALIVAGGRGGLGNAYFKTSTNQAPRKITEGKSGMNLGILLELRLLADIALVGLPNAGKSTLISSISEARPKIGDYPFTTLTPNLGVVSKDEESFVVADIPGLIEDASEGKGLGIKFLKHIERTKAIVHLIDISWTLDEYEAFEQYVTIRNELAKYSKNLINKKEIICLTKIDALTHDEIEKKRTFFENQLGKKCLPISAVSTKNIDLLKSLMIQTLK